LHKDEKKEPAQDIPENIHSVLLIGWGVENNLPFWILRNSYGLQAGENGHIRMERGVNAFGVETGIVSMEPVLCQESSSEACIPV